MGGKEGHGRQGTQMRLELLRQPQMLLFFGKVFVTPCLFVCWWCECVKE